MRLDPDCTRAILMAIEDVCDMTHIFDSKTDLNRIDGDFPGHKILYHAHQCYMSGFLVNFGTDMSGNWTASDLTPAGHQFIANIREDTIWNSVKEVAGKVGSKSLEAITQIASSVVTELIIRHLPPIQ